MNSKRVIEAATPGKVFVAFVEEANFDREYENGGGESDLDVYEVDGSEESVCNLSSRRVRSLARKCEEVEAVGVATVKFDESPDLFPPVVLRFKPKKWDKELGRSAIKSSLGGEEPIEVVLLYPELGTQFGG